MSDKTGISWTDATFNPWWGCTKVSPACDHCYAERDANRFAPGRVLWGVGSERRTFDEKHWQTPRKWAAVSWFECLDCGNRYSSTSRANRKAEFATCGHCGSERAKVVRRRVFCASMGDWLDLDAPLDQFVRLLDTIMRTPELDWLLLSKRIGNWRKRLEEAHARIVDTEGSDSVLAQWVRAWLDGNPPAHVIVMSTVIDQTEADRDVTKLLAVPARRRGLSIEPMLGPVELDRWLAIHKHWKSEDSLPAAPWHPPYPKHWYKLQALVGAGWEQPLHWVIAGGESGPHARPVHPDWIRSLRDQCAAAGVPFHFKQWGEWAVARPDHHPARLAHWWKDDPGNVVSMVNVGKAAAGRLLDGVAHDGFPT
jgi:protein gp37